MLSCSVCSREGSVIEEGWIREYEDGRTEGDRRLRKNSFLKIRDVIPKAPQKLSLPFDVDYKVRQDALKNRLAQQGIFVSSMKYKSKYGNYYSYTIMTR